MYDPQLYRDKEEVKDWETRGPLIRLSSQLKQMQLMTEEDFQRLQSAANAEVEDAVQFAEQAASEPVEQLQRFVYAEEAR